MSHAGVPMVLTICDKNNPEGVRMAIRDRKPSGAVPPRPSKNPLRKLIREGKARLGTESLSVSKVTLDDGSTLKRRSDLITGDKLTFHYATDTNRSSSDTVLGAAVLSRGSLDKPRSFRFWNQFLQYTLTFLLFVCMHQTFMWYTTDQHQRAETERIEAKISSMKYPDGVNFDL